MYLNEQEQFYLQKVRKLSASEQVIVFIHEIEFAVHLRNMKKCNEEKDFKHIFFSKKKTYFTEKQRC